jgi:putative membrane protein
MIRNFGDHAANERTFLAWVRTAIALMAFGFLVEKFDLFLEYAVPAMAGKVPTARSLAFGNAAGLALIAFGAGMVIMAAIRFVRTARQIDSGEVQPGTGSQLDVILAVLLVLLGLGLALYLLHALVTRV